MNRNNLFINRNDKCVSNNNEQDTFKFNNWGRRQYKQCNKFDNGEININNGEVNKFVDDKYYTNNQCMAQQIALELRKAADRIEQLTRNESSKPEQTFNETLKFNHGHESAYYQNFGIETLQKYNEYYKNMK